MSCVGGAIAVAFLLLAAAPSAGYGQVVRAVYLVPADRVEREDYRQAVDMAVRDIQWFYQAQLGDGRTFALDPNGVLVLHSAHQADWYGSHQPHGFGTFFDNVRADVEALTGRVPGSLHAGPDLWALYVDAQPACGQCGGCGGGRVTVIARNDLRGLVGESFEKVCPTDFDTNTRCRWVGGLGHELGHAMGLQHPAACEAGLPTCDWGALMFTGYASYPSTYLREDDKSVLRGTPYLSMHPPLEPAAVCGPVPPSAPGAFSVVLGDNRAARFSWSVPPAGGAPSAYQLRLGSAPGASNLRSVAVAGPTTEHVEQLPLGTLYARLIAVNAHGSSPASAELLLRVGTPAAPANLSVSLDGRVAALAWDAPPELIDGYILEAGSRPGGTDLATLPLSAARFVSPPLPPGTYFVRVRARNGAGPGPPTADARIEVPIPVVPGPPRSVTASIIGSTVTLAWEPPAVSTGGLGYVIEAGTSAGATNIAATSVGGARTWSVGGVPTGIYFVRVRARGEAGTGPASNEVRVVVGPPPPSAPTLTGSVGANGTVTLTWSVPSAGAAVVGYQLQAGSVPGAGNVAVVNVPSTQTVLVASGVPPGIYYVRVAANSAVGLGDASNEYVVVVP